MPPRIGQLVGRARELEELEAGLASTEGGRGAVWLLCGEAGMGKSRLAEEVAQRALTRGLQVHWGRCWEAGGAPAYWPWIQALRALWHADATERGAGTPGWARPHAAQLGQLVPELLPDDVGPARNSVAPDQARFLLLDGLCAAFIGAARADPLLLVLEDLHAADEASLSALSVLAGQVRSAPLMVLGTYRDAGPQAGGRLLADLSHRVHTLSLAPLSLDDVTRYVQQELGEAEDAAVARLHALCEGNPLCVVECVRLWSRRGPEALSPARLALDAGLSALLDERLQAVPPDVRQVLEVLSVVGREVPRELRDALVPGADREAAIRQALQAALLEQLDGGALRFSHVLLREALYHRLSVEGREKLHAAVAARLDVAARRDAASRAQLAHHLRHAGAAHRQRALEVTLQGARHELEALAFESAAEGYRAALALLPVDEEATTRAQLLLELARAELRAGQAEAGRARAREAAQLFTALEDPQGFARAALEHGSLLRFGHVDAELIALLGEASQRLPEGPSPLKARVLARLAAATQPSFEPERAIALARRSIQMARELGEQRLLLEVLYVASSALMDILDASERRPVNEEHAALAELLDDPVHALRARTRLVFDCFELGDFEALRRSVVQAEQHAARLDHPLFAWIPLALTGAQALYQGAAVRARGVVEQLCVLEERGHPDPNLPGALRWQQVYLARLEGEGEERDRRTRELLGLYTGSSQAGLLGRLFALHEALHDAPERLDVDFSAEDAEVMLSLRDCTALSPLAQWAFHRDDRALGERVDARLAELSHTHTGMGVMTMVWDGPLALARGLSAAVLGEHGRAERCFEQAFGLALEHGAEPAAARIVRWWTRAWDRAPAGAMQAAPLRAALERAQRLSAAEPGVVAKLRRWSPQRPVSEAVASPASSPGAPPAFSLQRDGEQYRLRVGERSVALRDTKGVRWLATLLAEPGRAFHVLTLSADGAEPAAVDTGDAGPLLDAKAVSAYRARLRELTQAREQAEADRDLGRLERVSQEQEALHAQLAAGLGSGGRLRRDKGATERARVNVQRRLKDAIQRVGEIDAALGRHLERSVRTGVQCVYDPP